MTTNDSTEQPNEKVSNLQNGEPSNNSILNANMISMLGNSVEGIQSSFGAVFNTLASNLRQSLEMTQTMNAVMEQVLVSSLKIRAIITSNTTTPSHPKLALTLTNTSAIPISRAKLELNFESVGSDKTMVKEFKYDLIPDTSMRVSSATNSHSKLPHLSILSSSQPFTLPPQTAHTEHCILKPPCLAQYNATICVSFPSPGTGNMLKVETGFGVYFVDQLTKVTHPSSDVKESKLEVMDPETDQPIRRAYPVEYLRRMVRTSGLIGIMKGGWVEFEGDKNSLKFSFHFLNVDERTEMVEVGAFAESNDEDIRKVILGVVTELDGLMNVNKDDN